MSTYFVSSLRKGLEVLTCFGRQQVRLTVSDVARLTSVSPASARRSLLTLVDLGYLGADGKYFWMLPKCLLIAHAFLSSGPLPSLAQPLLDSFSARTRESVSLGQLMGDDVITVARATGRRSLSTGLGVGSRLPSYCSAIGRVLLADLPPIAVAARLESIPRPALTSKTVTDVHQILDILDRCRESGWSSSDGEIEVGVRALAVPVRDLKGRAMAGLSIAARVERVGMNEFQAILLKPLMGVRDALQEQLFPSLAHKSTSNHPPAKPGAFKL
ncbi:IclR family transcriptional regulator C-terminal domain-containing protein [Polaromonas sp. C04]|uniref:IclR family transcriptional regulator domain-containing protein n=1 Tax=Polaromonas sp. C04 TaxID=1945857 RepID=UPI0009846E2C|nr:IclR family transcriptional regulator C-terminal domain-containing protein [Polaromonas sp. C04]OOG57998.1 IclR family transcriptional regulator [Polaromonas sp. C04]